MVHKVIKSSPLASTLLFWYDNRQHNFPWRGTNNPYKTWLSEVMLQQTQVQTVIPYYSRWIAMFPGIRSVAKAKLDLLLKMWEGLGYYARVRNFHSACKVIMNKYSGEVPNNYDILLTLPGVGPYISGAVMSIAFNFPVPAVDSNAFRVISRLYAIDGAVLKVKKKVEIVLSGLICIVRPGDFNQAIMDLGREICTSKYPACNICPLKSFCVATVNNTVDKYPVKAKVRKKPHYNIVVGIIWNKNEILISKRREGGLLGGLWEFPSGKIKDGETAIKCVIREVKEDLGVHVRPGAFLKQINHAYSHFSITCYAYHCDYVGGVPRALRCSDWRWIKPKHISNFPFPSVNHKLFDLIHKGLA